MSYEIEDHRLGFADLHRRIACGVPRSALHLGAERHGVAMHHDVTTALPDGYEPVRLEVKPRVR